MITTSDRMKVSEYLQDIPPGRLATAVRSATYAEAFPHSYTVEALALSKRLIRAIADEDPLEIFGASWSIVDLREDKGWYRA